MNAQQKSLPRSLVVQGCVWLSIFLICFGSNITTARATVTINYFTAAWINDDILVSWETATEVDIEHFYVQRFDSESGNYVRISTVIPAIGEPQSGATYQFVDSNVTGGTTYWYILEAVEVDNDSEFFGPVSSNPAALTPTATATGVLTNTPTPTNTPTLTQTGLPATSPSPTFTITPPQSFSTGTQTIAPTSQATATTSSGTAYPAPLTVTPVFQPTNAALQTTQPVLPTQSALITSEAITEPALITATTTLIPLPDITLTFPAGGILIQERGAPTASPEPARQSIPTPSWDPFGGLMLISVILAIWALLGVWFYLSLRRIE